MARGSRGQGQGRGGGGRGLQRGRGHAPRITAVEVFVYRETEVGVEYLLLKRESGLWQPPCGKIDDKEVPIEAAHREVHEETGFRATSVRPAHWADAFVDPEQGRLYLLPVFVAEAPPDAEVRIGPEHVEHAWLAMDAAIEQLPYHGYREALKAADAARRMPVMRHAPSAPAPAAAGEERRAGSPQPGASAAAGKRRRRRRGRRGRGGSAGESRGPGGGGGPE